MNTLTLILQFGIMIMMLALGSSLSNQGIINAQATVKVGAFVARIGGRTVALDLVEVYREKYYYRLAIVQA